MRPWVQVDIQLDEYGGIQTGIGGSWANSCVAVSPVKGLALSDLLALTDGVRRASLAGVDMDADSRKVARRLYVGLFDGPVGREFDQLRGKTDGRPLLVRLRLNAPLLHAVPWEALIGPDATSVPIGLSNALLIVREPQGSTPPMGREVSGSLNILVVAPDDTEPLAHNLHSHLQPLIEQGLVAWQRPLLDDEATWPALIDRVRDVQPHVLHIIAHGKAGQDEPPQIRLAGPQGPTWIGAADLAEMLSRHARQTLRLVYLQSCDTAAPVPTGVAAGARHTDSGALASAAELIAARSAQAVIAHLWRVSGVGAAQIAGRFYAALTDSKGADGDIGQAISSARLDTHPSVRAEAFCPVLLSGAGRTNLFSFGLRTVRPLADLSLTTAATLTERQTELSIQLGRLMKDHGSVFLGEFAEPSYDRAARDRILPPLANTVSPGERETLSSLLQRYSFRVNSTKLSFDWQRALGRAQRDLSAAPGGVIAALAAQARPGVYLTLQWLPALETQLSQRHPDTNIWVVQPSLPGQLDDAVVYTRPAGQDPLDWQIHEDSQGLPQTVDFTRDFVVLRLFGGLDSERMAVGAVITDDHKLALVANVTNLPENVLGWIRHHPMAILGFSGTNWTHRELLRRLMGPFPLVEGGLVVLPPDATEDDRFFWKGPRAPAGFQHKNTYEFDDLAPVLGLK